MSLRRALLTVVLSSTALLSACALRPTYRELVAPNAAEVTAGQTVALRVVDGAGKPVQGAKVRAGERRTRMNLVSDADGLVTLETNADLLKENPLVEVVLPKGVSQYRLQLVPSGQSPAELAPQAPAAPEQAPGTEAPEAQPTTPASPETAPQAPATPATPGT
ncbi:hypothetical protein OWM54_24960 [Myxococcus sp. MISCRS1]|jgi:hypothetical protein|uniref:hypothetical protein n=1 Tax=Myxococcus TaxID=32 RepID=UPI001CC07A56|nr:MULTISPECIES: hypothetical protein [unclassified Myxococcus]MBZ4396550.1 hypothetical protein [Myxococcus sp. AS-1-15]MBZ4411742.1 hypothetical protein [Myxococcus sp. XM-1-1-1]MCY1000396.1 hypothetical protein [Myxococcus sp. MISCRS1]